VFFGPRPLAGLTAVDLADLPFLECWLVFACDQHVEEIDAARPLLQRDEAVRQVWLEHQFGELQNEVERETLQPVIRPVPAAQVLDGAADELGWLGPSWRAGIKQGAGFGVPVVGRL